MELTSCSICFTVSPDIPIRGLKMKIHGTELHIWEERSLHWGLFWTIAHQNADWAEGIKGWCDEIGAGGASDSTTHHHATNDMVPHAALSPAANVWCHTFIGALPFVQQQGLVALMICGGKEFWKHTLNWTFLVIMQTLIWLKKLAAKLDSTCFTL